MVRSWCLRALLLLSLLGVSSSYVLGVDTPGVDDVLVYLEAARSKLQSYHLEVTTQALDAASGKTLEKSVFVFDRASDRTYCEIRRSAASDGPESRMVSVWDNKRFLIQRQDAPAARVDGFIMPSPRISEQEVLVNPIACAGLRQAASTDGVPRTNDDIVGLLRNPKVSRLAADRVTVDGHEYLLMEVGPLPKVSFRYYLDESHGFVVARYERIDSDTGDLLFRLTNEEFREVRPGVWLPFRTTRQFMDTGSKTVREADRTEVQALDIGVSFPESHFTFTFPPRAMVWDMIRQLRYEMPSLPSGEDIEAMMAQAAPANAVSLRPTSAGGLVDDAKSLATGGGWGTGGLTVAVLCGIGIAVWWLTMRRRSHS
jgi:hypothetical protein